MSAKFKSIGLVVRNDMQSRQDSIRQVIDVLARHADVLVHCLDFEQPLVEISSVSLEHLVDRVDLVISLGGDGTLLTAARALANKNTPLLGINLGRLGFLADVSFDDYESYIDEVVNGRYSVEKRFFIEGSFYRGDELLSTNIALNDIILHSHESANMIEYEVSSGGHLIHIQRSDGVIVSTPTGSTAYAMSGGGPIIHPSLETLAIVPICPHTLSNRPIVLPADQPIEVRLGQDSHIAKVSYDGHSTKTVGPDNRVLITRYSEPLTLLHPEDYDYFQVLRSKLFWSTNY
ncbi:MAG: NAD(+) kinase [Gammaproteobacteria bacterium]|nr:MAG: NAD(+) kinase [Gammaproteobacteria bacterium]UCH39504.1 MAG: NAD(+) kinase [Gammaproteobacteria bacterium]